MDTLTIILIVAIIIFVIAAVVLIVMLLGGPSEGRPSIPIASDRTLPGTARRAAAPGAMVVVLQGKNQGKRAAFRNDRVTIGRGNECSIMMDEPLVSRLHAEVKFDNGRFTLEDPGSANGIWMHGQRVLQVELKDGDQFRIGRSVFAFVLPGGAMPVSVQEEERPRERVRKRDVSFGPRTLAGARAWDRWQSLFCTLTKLGQNAYQFVLDRLRGQGEIPTLAESITKRADELHLGWSWGLRPAPGG